MVFFFWGCFFGVFFLGGVFFFLVFFFWGCFFCVFFWGVFFVLFCGFVCVFFFLGGFAVAFLVFFFFLFLRCPPESHSWGELIAFKCFCCA